MSGIYELFARGLAARYLLYAETVSGLAPTPSSFFTTILVLKKRKRICRAIELNSRYADQNNLAHPEYLGKLLTRLHLFFALRMRARKRGEVKRT